MPECKKPKDKYGFDKSFVLVSVLRNEAVEDLKSLLRKTGYSDRALEEILEWYR